MCEERTKQLHQNHAGCGRACDVGSMVTPPQLKHVDELVRDAIANGAIALCGGKIAESKDGSVPSLLSFAYLGPKDCCCLFGRPADRETLLLLRL